MGSGISISVKTVNIVVILILLMGTACSSSQKSSSNDNDNIGQNDSLNLNNPDMPKENLAPGTAYIVLKDLEVSDQENGNVAMEAILIRVLGYGPATPPLSPGTKISVDASEYFMNTDMEADYYTKQDSLTCLVSKQGDSPSGTASSSWKLMNIYSK
jgi:hypothetical protein